MAAAVILVALSVAGYSQLEHWSLFDALYMTVITLGTIGFGEVRPLDTSGRLITMAIIIFGFAVIVYTAASLSDLFLSGDLARAFQKRRRQRMKDKLSNHVIVAGAGRVGMATVRELRARRMPVLVIDPDPNKEPVVSAAGAVFSVGDGRDATDLDVAGIHRAVALVATASDDPTNLVVILTARTLRPDLRLVSRVSQSDWTDRLERAGADLIVSPYETAGTSLAITAASPSILDIHDLPDLGLRTEELQIGKGHPLEGSRPGELSLRYPHVLFLAVRRADQQHRFVEFEDIIREDDVLVLLGPPDQIDLVVDSKV